MAIRLGILAWSPLRFIGPHVNITSRFRTSILIGCDDKRASITPTSGHERRAEERDAGGGQRIDQINSWLLVGGYVPADEYQRLRDAGVSDNLMPDSSAVSRSARYPDRSIGWLWRLCSDTRDKEHKVRCSVSRTRTLCTQMENFRPSRIVSYAIRWSRSDSKMASRNLPPRGTLDTSLERPHNPKVGVRIPLPPPKIESRGPRKRVL